MLRRCSKRSGMALRVAVSVSGFDMREFTFFGFYIPWALLAAAELTFIIYDKAVTAVVYRYVPSIRNKIFKIRHSKSVCVSVLCVIFSRVNLYGFTVP